MLISLPREETQGLLFPVRQAIRGNAPCVRLHCWFLGPMLADGAGAKSLKLCPRITADITARTRRRTIVRDHVVHACGASRRLSLSVTSVGVDVADVLESSESLQYFASILAIFAIPSLALGSNMRQLLPSYILPPVSNRGAVQSGPWTGTFSCRLSLYGLHGSQISIKNKEKIKVRKIKKEIAFP